MKMMLIIVDSGLSDSVEEILNSPEVQGFTEIPGVLGKGILGAKLGNRAFPGSSDLYFAAVPAKSCEKILDAIKSVGRNTEGLKVFTIDAVEAI